MVYMTNKRGQNLSKFANIDKFSCADVFPFAIGNTFWCADVFSFAVGNTFWCADVFPFAAGNTFRCPDVATFANMGHFYPKESFSCKNGRRKNV